MPRKVDPALLPHPRPCRCDECTRTYQRIYQSAYVPKRKPRKRESIVSITIRRCSCGAVLGSDRRKMVCRACYLESVTKTKRSRRTCEYCKRSWLSQIADASFCSKTCEREATLGLLAFIKPTGWVRGVCHHCGSACDNFTCDRCLRKNRMMHIRLYTNRKRGARVAGPYDRREIAERDGWLCHLCNGPVAPHLWGINDPGAPNIDHVIPISRGGHDTADNVKLAHQVCNFRKNNKLEGEATPIRRKRAGRQGLAQAA